MYKQAFQDFIQRYVKIWKQVWAIRDQLDPPKRDKDEREFLPAHLELTETPLSAAPKVAARLIMVFALLTLCWSLIGKFDIVATAQGKTSLGGRSKTIQSLETAVVDKINVHDGQMVKKGDVLLQLSGIGSETDYHRASDALKATYMTKWRAESLLQSLEQRRYISLEKLIVPAKNDSTEIIQQIIASISTEEKIQAEHLVSNQYQTWMTKNQQLMSIKAQHASELASTQAQIQKLIAMTDIEKQRTSDYQELVSQNFLAKHNLLEQQSKYIQSKNDLLSQRQNAQQAQHAIQQAEDELVLNTQNLKRDAFDQLRQANEQIPQLTSELLKSQQRQQLMQITAPVDGTVQQLATHTLGGVVTAAQPLMTIVPKDRIEVEAIVPNKDIGFVHEGQDVVVKVESFPYTRYGYLTGKVKSVSFDSIENKDLGLVYSAIITLDQDSLNIDGKMIRVDAGMNVSAEIKTGKRRVISYLLSPLQTKVDESMRER
ncbi:HlyD family type I secretion periplasmic adaptor subunit [Acinetobacter sp. B5B]|uniref:HlyD family type I secretion periplasmic adaptor subunit n=1 Tax=Acinetobacter baretiae TaxID=2605383 RepID=UPI0018C22249|nr:HlyD family type I secretion periplasmic adaptor subunit [Acinetobacter baretiae]MBF7683989.1 HlyD family type I secretion periplasmic adaptor subunit [Acinetobacter baretiae]